MNRFPVENIDKVEEATNAELASKATQLETSRTIKLTGDVTGSASFNGTGDASITATVKDDSHNHTVANIDGLQTTLDNINDTIESAVSTAGASLEVSGTTLKLKDSSGNVLSTVTTQDTNTTYTAATATPLVAGTAAVGTSAKYAREDHVHPVQTSVTGSSGSCTGNAATATKATQDESGNNIKASYAASMSISGGTITLKNKNGATLSSGTVSVSATSAAKLTTARTITIPAALVGTGVSNATISFDGSANKTFACTSCTTSCSTKCVGCSDCSSSTCSCFIDGYIPTINGLVHISDIKINNFIKDINGKFYKIIYKNHCTVPSDKKIIHYKNAILTDDHLVMHNGIPSAFSNSYLDYTKITNNNIIYGTYKEMPNKIIDKTEFIYLDNCNFTEYQLIVETTDCNPVYTYLNDAIVQIATSFVEI